MSGPAPIAVFIYNRPDHLRRTLASLARCDGFEASPIVVFGDGAKRPEHEPAVAAARAVARAMLANRASYRFLDANKGLARSIIEGVRSLTAEHGSVIVVEDDLALAPYFLVYMNAALDRYAAEDRVMQISGYAFHAPELAGIGRAVMLPLTTTWGWATWGRAWAQFDEAASGWQELRRDAGQRQRFNLGGVYDYAGMLEHQMAGRSDSWGIRWYWTVFRRNGLAVFPCQTLVRNDGMDGGGTHGRGWLRNYATGSFAEGPLSLPEAVPDAAALAAVRRAIWRQNGGTLGSLVDRVKRAI